MYAYELTPGQSFLVETDGILAGKLLLYVGNGNHPDGYAINAVDMQTERAVGVGPLVPVRLATAEECRAAMRGDWPTADLVANIIGVDAIRSAAERIHKNNPRQLGNLHAIWCVGHAVLTLAIERGIEPPVWWADWRRGGQLEALTELVAPDTPAPKPEEMQARTCHYCGMPATGIGFFGEPVCKECGG